MPQFLGLLAIIKIITGVIEFIFSFMLRWMQVTHKMEASEGRATLSLFLSLIVTCCITALIELGERQGHYLIGQYLYFLVYGSSYNSQVSVIQLLVANSWANCRTTLWGWVLPVSCSYIRCGVPHFQIAARCFNLKQKKNTVSVLQESKAESGRKKHQQVKRMFKFYLFLLDNVSKI